MRRVPHCHPEIGDGGAPVANIPQPGAPGEAPDGGEVDNGEGYERGPPYRCRNMFSHALIGRPAARLEMMVLVIHSYVMVCIVGKRR